MKSIVRRPKFAIAGLFCAAVALASCSTPPPPTVVAVAPPPAVSLPAKVVDAAAVYEAYVEQASALTNDFDDGAMVAAKLKVAAAYQAQQFQRGEAAYAAIVALQDPAFVAGVRAYTTDPEVRGRIVAELMKDPAYVIGIKGSDSAAGLAIAALDAHGLGLRTAGERIKQAAYDVQRKPWSKAAVTDRPSRLAAVKSLSTTPGLAPAEKSSRLLMASTGQTPLALSGQAAPPPYTPLIVRGLAVAAMAVLGEGGEANADLLWTVLGEPNQDLCFSLAKLNVNQCLAVAKPHYEDVFCLGVHALADTGACIIKGAGAGKTAPALVAAAIPASAPAAISLAPPGALKAQ